VHLDIVLTFLPNIAPVLYGRLPSWALSSVVAIYLSREQLRFVCRDLQTVCHRVMELSRL